MKFAVANSTLCTPDLAWFHDWVTTQMTLDARGTGMTPAAGHVLVDIAKVIVGISQVLAFIRGCNAGNASA
jgi:hypothetical protein